MGNTPDLTAPEQVDTSRPRIEKLHSMGCVDYLHLALLSRAESAEAENEDCLDKLETALDQRDAADARADYWHQESRIQFEAKNKAREDRDEAVQLLIYMVNHATWREENEGVFWEATEKARAFIAARKKEA